MWTKLLVAVSLCVACANAQASCRFPSDRITSPAKVAALLLERSDFVGFARVERPLSTRTLDQPEQLEVLLPFKGPQGLLTLQNPVISPGVLTVTDSSPSFYADQGSIVFGALLRTKSGWIRGECGQQLILKYPLPRLVAELRRARPR